MSEAERHLLAVPGGTVAMVLHVPGAAPGPFVVTCHGLTASKDSDKYLLLADELGKAGIGVARFDFRGCGESSGVEDDTTVATRLDDARAVLACLRQHPRSSGRVGLLGSSMGGFVALHLARELKQAPVVTWNAPASLLGLAYSEQHDGAGLGFAFFEELASGHYAETPSGVARHLVIHAEADDVVPLEHATVLHARAAQPCDFLVVAGADHRLTDPTHRRFAVEKSLEWFQRFL